MEKQSLILSVIIPLYNCREFIAGCIRSIYDIDLSEDKFEIIIVDDGGIICKEYERSHSNFHFLEQKNTGASSARNKGLDIAKGHWVWFVDADDKVGIAINELIPTMISCNNVDMICFNYSIEEENNIRNVRDFDMSCNYDGMGYLNLHHRLYLWNKIISRSVIGENRFLDGTKNIEDMLFCVETIIDMGNILCSPVYGYVYNNLNMSSTSRRRDKRNLIKLDQDSILILSALKDFSDLRYGRKAEIIKDIENFSIVGHFYSLMSFYTVKRLRHAIKRYRELGLYPLKMTNNRKANLFILLVNRERVICLLKRFLDFLEKMKSYCFIN